MTNNALTPRFLLTLRAPWRAVRVGSQVFLGWKRKRELFHPGKHEQQCWEWDAKTIQAAPQCACSFISSFPLSVPWIGKKNPNKKIYSYRSVRACMPPPPRSLLEPLRLIFEFSASDSSSLSLSPSLSLSLRAVLGLFVPACDQPHELTARFLHGAAGAHPQSPRTGRTLLTSLGEFTEGAGLQRCMRVWACAGVRALASGKNEVG